MDRFEDTSGEKTKTKKQTKNSLTPIRLGLEV